VFCPYVFNHSFLWVIGTTCNVQTYILCLYCAVVHVFITFVFLHHLPLVTIRKEVVHKTELQHVG